MKSAFKIICLCLVFYSCQKNIEGYTAVEDGIYLKLLSFNNNSQAYQEGDYMIFSLEALDGDSIVFQHSKYNPFLPLNTRMDKAIKQLHLGDSVEFLIDKSVFDENSFGFTSKSLKSEYISITIKVHEYLNKERYTEYLKSKDDELIEQQVLAEYLKTRKDLELIQGVYIQKLNKTKEKQVAKGDKISIQYTGSFINGVVFDTAKTKESFVFTYGSPNQVIVGLEKVLKVLKKGEKAKIIIPSQFAFGEKGSSTGIVPPYSTVIYNLEIKNIKQR